MTNIPTLVAAAAFAAASFTACGSKTDADRIRQAVDDALTTFARHDNREICDFMKESGLAGTEDPDRVCELFIETLDMLPEHQRRAFADFEVKRVTIKGDRALIPPEDVRVPPELEAAGAVWNDPVLVVRKNGRWQVKATNR